MRRRILLLATNNSQDSLVKVDANFVAVGENKFPNRKYKLNLIIQGTKKTLFSNYPMYGVIQENGIQFLVANDTRRSDTTDYGNVATYATVNGVKYVLDFSVRAFDNICETNCPIIDWYAVENRRGGIVQKADLSKMGASDSVILCSVPSVWNYYVHAIYDGVACIVLSDSPIYCYGEGSKKQLVFKANSYMWIGYKCYGDLPTKVSNGITVNKQQESYRGVKDFKNGYKITEQTFKQIVFNNADIYKWV